MVCGFISGENFPKHVGLPIGENNARFYMLEIHFDNPTMIQSRDTSGLRLRYTENIRENDGGILTTGIYLSNLHIIPPLQNLYTSAGYCSQHCTRQVIFKC